MQLHLDTYGTYLHIKDQLFEVRKQVDGETVKKQFAAHKIKSIWVGEGIALSSEAVKLAIKNNIDIIFLEYNGQPLGRVWHSKLGSTTLIRKRQLEVSLGPGGLKYTKQWLVRKLDNQLSFLRDLRKHRKQHHDYLYEKLNRIQAMRDRIIEVKGGHVDAVAEQLRGLEGTAGRLYFQTLSYVLPPSYQFGGRSFRPAADSFNAFLNYAYGVLYSQTEKALMLAGLDPYVGFLHRDDYNYKSMVYDYIEPYRLFADKVVFSLFTAKKVNRSHTDRIANGVRLNQTGKRLLLERYNQYMEGEKVRYRGRNQTRNNILLFDARQFANELIDKSQTL